MKDVLKNYFGYDEFKENQEDVIKSVLGGRDVFVQMATGSGKSLCFQIPAMMLPGVTLVVSPLIALMKDQVDALRVNGVGAEYINSSLSDLKIAEVMGRVEGGEVKILYVAPERFGVGSFCNFLRGVDVSLIAIDEAHCISTWGHDFRIDYRNLGMLKKKFCGVPIIALTATATKQVREDVIEQLCLVEPEVFVSSFDRRNLNYYVMKKRDAFDRLVEVLSEHVDESAIVYCFSRKDCEKVSSKLNSIGFSSLPYHAGLPKKTRVENQEDFINDRVNIVVATIAFGMGIDKSDIRLIVHYTFPKSVEGYYQEVGRAGRDGLPSDCVMFYSKGDASKHKYFIRQIFDDKVKWKAQGKLDEIVGFCESFVCRRKRLLEYFGEEYVEENCGGCDVCLGVMGKDKFERKEEKGDYDKKLYRQLKILRNGISKRKGVPGFILLDDLSLRKIADCKPKSREELLNIPGMSKQKVEDFGDEILSVVVEYRGGKSFGLGVSDHYDRTVEGIRNRDSVEKMAKEQGYAVGTIINHIEKVVNIYHLDIDYLKPGSFDRIKVAFDKFGFEKLKPVFDYFGEEISYEEIKMVRIFLDYEEFGERGEG